MGKKSRLKLEARENGHRFTSNLKKPVTDKSRNEYYEQFMSHMTMNREPDLHYYSGTYTQTNASSPRDNSLEGEFRVVNDVELIEGNHE